MWKKITNEMRNIINKSVYLNETTGRSLANKSLEEKLRILGVP